MTTTLKPEKHALAPQALRLGRVGRVLHVLSPNQKVRCGCDACPKPEPLKASWGEIGRSDVHPIQSRGDWEVAEVPHCIPLV